MTAKKIALGFASRSEKMAEKKSRSASPREF